jgi:hypothetical protein
MTLNQAMPSIIKISKSNYVVKELTKTTNDISKLDRTHILQTSIKYLKMENASLTS